jgi:hypothetical protein
VVHVVVRPKRQRDRRRRDSIERARQLLVSLKSYLMAHDLAVTECPSGDPQDRENVVKKAKQVLTYWLRK